MIQPFDRVDGVLGLGHRVASLSVFVLLLGPPAGVAAGIHINIVDNKGQPVPDVVAYAAAETGGSLPEPEPGGVAVMDQVDKKFVPHILVVRTGTEVRFPNSDSVSHHVYSFSRPHQFELPLYKGKLRPAVHFEQEGLAILGCNIHDQMLGYILVVDTPFFGKTDEEGRLRLDDLPPGEYRIRLWSPRVRDPQASLSKLAALQDNEHANVEFRLTRKLQPLSAAQDSLSWSEY